MLSREPRKNIAIKFNEQRRCLENANNKKCCVVAERGSFRVSSMMKSNIHTLCVWIEYYDERQLLYD